MRKFAIICPDFATFRAFLKERGNSYRRFIPDAEADKLSESDPGEFLKVSSAEDCYGYEFRGYWIRGADFPGRKEALTAALRRMR